MYTHPISKSRAPLHMFLSARIMPRITQNKLKVVFHLRNKNPPKHLVAKSICARKFVLSMFRALRHAQSGSKTLSLIIRIRILPAQMSHNAPLHTPYKLCVRHRQNFWMSLTTPLQNSIADPFSSPLSAVKPDMASIRLI